jgi:hypothetical protein
LKGEKEKERENDRSVFFLFEQLLQFFLGILSVRPPQGLGVTWPAKGEVLAKIRALFFYNPISTWLAALVVTRGIEKSTIVAAV